VHDCRDPRIFYKEAISLTNAGHNVCIIASNCESHEKNGIKIIGVGRWKTRMTRFLKIIPIILWKALKTKADIYHLHDPELLVIAPILRLSGSIVIYDIHENIVTNIRQKPYILAILRYPLALIIGVLEKVLAIVCYKIIAERYYKERYPNAVEVLNYTDLDRFSVSKSKYEKLKLDARYNWYLYTGNITEERGALANLRLLEISNRAGIAYIGKCYSHVAQKIRNYAKANNIHDDRIRIIGEGRFMEPQEIVWYGKTEPWVAGIALFPDTDHYKKKELTKFFEYMEMGLPILASNFPVWRKLIEDNRAGYVVNVSDAEEILKITQDLEGDYRRKGRRNDLSALVKEKYSWKLQEKNLLSLYNGMTSVQ
jgi:glycosyltransferase involved in cell wall biosynthesis